MTHLRILSREANLIQFVLPKDHSSSVVGGTDLRQMYEDEHLASQEKRAGKTVLPNKG